MLSVWLLINAPETAAAISIQLYFSLSSRPQLLEGEISCPVYRRGKQRCQQGEDPMPFRSP